jgi:hypothetical protein
MTRKLVHASVLSSVLALIATAQAVAFGATSLDEAKKMAAEKSLPILMDFGTEW